MSDSDGKNAEQPANKVAGPKRRLTKKVPTFRAGFAKHLDCLRAYAVLSENGTKPVHYVKIGPIITLHEANVSSMNPFFMESGLIEKRQGGYMPCEAVLDYNRAYAWDKDTAGHKLAPTIRDTWFGHELTQRLQFDSMDEDTAIKLFADICNAGPEVRGQLRMLIDFCETAGLVKRDGSQIFSAESAAPRQRETAHAQPDSQPSIKPTTLPVSESAAQPAAPKQPSADLPSHSGTVHFQISANVDMTEMSGWSADRIAAFFAGIAQVLAAQGQGDQEGGAG